MHTIQFSLLVLLLIAFTSGIHGEQPSTAERNDSMAHRMTQKMLFEKLIGEWKGTCRTWFEPDKLADESIVTGKIASVLDGRFLRHTYEGTIRGQPRHGEELLGFNAVTKAFQSSWVDSFHMNYAIMFSQGGASDCGFDIRGEYDVAENQPKWGWRTVFQLVDDDHLMITAYNVSPDGTEAKAVETAYLRIQKVDRDDK